jgi:lysophospholipase L1-like esterase
MQSENGTSVGVCATKLSPRLRRGLIGAGLLVLAFCLSGRLPWHRFVQDAAPKSPLISWLETFDTVYPFVLMSEWFAGAILIVVLLAGSKSPLARRILARVTLVWAALLVCFLLSEGAAWGVLAWKHRMPSMPIWPVPENPSGTAPYIGSERTLAGAKREAANRDVHVVVVGESSAEGVPYRDWVSVGKIVVWQLRKSIPTRMFHLENQARAGWTLEQMHQRLAGLKYRPDAVIIYAGHNEFASRFGWSHSAPYYLEDHPQSFVGKLARRIGEVSYVSRLTGETAELERVAAPPARVARTLIDSPSFSRQQYEEQLRDFRRRLEAMVAFCQRSAIITILVIPPGNDAGFEPNRSVMPPETPRVEREAFAAALSEAKTWESTDPERSLTRYRSLITQQPGVAEAHFRLARLLERLGHNNEANVEFILARDLDALPMRCLSAFQDAYRDLARRFDVILVDGPASLRARNPRGLLDDTLFNDGVHPSVEGQIGLSEAILAGLNARGLFGWQKLATAPTIDLKECADHFDVSAAAWIAACKFGSEFYQITGPIRFDGAEREGKRRRYADARRLLAAGHSPDEIACPGIGTRSVQERSD